MNIRSAFSKTAEKLKAATNRIRHPRSSAAKPPVLPIDPINSDNVNNNNGAALIQAIDSHAIPRIEKLVSLGADVHIDQEAPLRHAITTHNAAMVFVLIQNGANFEAATAYIKNSTDTAAKAGLNLISRKFPTRIKKEIMTANARIG
jgi:hypothetical protein